MPRGGDFGWIALGAGAAAFNIVQAGQQKEMLCGAFRRHAREHPALTAAVTFGLVAHFYGRLPHRVDPLYHGGVVAERIAEIAASWRAHRP